MTATNHDIIVGARMIGGFGTAVIDDEPAGAAIQVLWIKFGDVYLTNGDACIVSVDHHADKDVHTAVVKFCVGRYSVVDAFGPDAPESVREKP